MTTQASYITAVDCLDGPSDWVESGGPGTGRDIGNGVPDQDARPSGSPRSRGRHCLIEYETRKTVAKAMRHSYRRMRDWGVRRSTARMLAGEIAYVAGVAAHDGRMAEIRGRTPSGGTGTVKED